MTHFPPKNWSEQSMSPHHLHSRSFSILFQSLVRVLAPLTIAIEDGLDPCPNIDTGCMLRTKCFNFYKIGKPVHYS